MARVNCVICGKGFEIKEYDRKRRKICGSDECKRNSSVLRMRKYRETERGLESVKRYNATKKVMEITVECLGCGENFLTARKSKLFCDKEGCRRKARSYYSARCRNRRKEHYKEIGSANKAASRVLGNGLCVVCGSEKNIDRHHHNYRNRLDVTYLCRKHHKDMHSWDSN